MNNKHQNTHVLFSLSLFLLFVIGSFFIVTYEIRGYQSINDTCRLEDELSTPLAYFNTKLKANDRDNSTKITKLNGVQCLRIHTGETYTYIYLQDGYLTELYGRKDYDFHLSEGNKLFPLDELNMKQKGHLFSIQVTKNNKSKSIDIYTHG